METKRLDAGTTIHRVHRAANGPIFFDAGSGGRFNPRGVVGWGTCYFATDPLGAFVESFRRRYVTWAEIVERRLTAGVLTGSIELFDATARLNRFDPDVPVTAALSSGPHGDAQAAASELVGRVDGIYYRLKHDPAGDLAGVALFGEVGAPAQLGLLDLKTDAIPLDLVERARREFGYAVFRSEPTLG